MTATSNSNSVNHTNTSSANPTAQTNPVQRAGLQAGVEICQRCHHSCLHMAMTHCLEMGGKHMQPEHLKLMFNCAEICQTAANFMLSHSPLHGVVCTACAQVCEACADSCEQIGNMEECAQICRDCAQQCQAMGAVTATTH